MVGTFSGKKSLKALSNKVFRFIQQTLYKGFTPYNSRPLHNTNRRTEKINGLTAGIAYQQFTNRGILIALVVAILGGAAKLFGFFPPINLLIKFLVKKR